MGGGAESAGDGAEIPTAGCSSQWCARDNVVVGDAPLGVYRADDLSFYNMSSQKRKLEGGAGGADAESSQPPPQAPPPKLPAAAASAGPAAAFTQRLADLTAVARGLRDGWMAALDIVRAASQLTDEDFHAEGRRLAVERHGEAVSPYFWPEPPSMAVLIKHSVRTDAEEALCTDVDALCESIAATKELQVARITEAKAASPPDVELVREIGRGIGSLTAVMSTARGLDTSARKRLQLATQRISKYRAACSVRPLESGARLVNVPPTSTGHEQVRATAFTTVCTEVGSRATGRAPYSPSPGPSLSARPELTPSADI